MALSSCEIAEEDCGCTSGLVIKVMSPLHLRTLVGKYWKPSHSDEEWRLVDGSESEIVGRTITIRSPMTCQTKNFKICRKCFGEKRIRTPYVGITAGHCATERLTQLLMRTFHKKISVEKIKKRKN